MHENTNNYFQELEKKKLEKNEKEKKKEQERILAGEKKKAEIREEEITAARLEQLRNLLEAHIIDAGLVEKVLAGKTIESQEIQKIFEKIDEIEQLKDSEKYLPKSMRVKKEEYLHALHDDEALAVLQDKIQKNLAHISQFLVPEHSSSLNIFSGYLLVLDQNLVVLQEHHIDMQDALRKNQKNHKKRFLECIRRLF